MVCFVDTPAPRLRAGVVKSVVSRDSCRCSEDTMPSIRTRQAAFPGILDEATGLPDGKTVLAAYAVMVWPPLVDRAPLTRSAVGLFTSLTAFRQALKQDARRERFMQPPNPDGFLRYHLRRERLDLNYVRGYEQTYVLDAQGRFVCESPLEKKRWYGQAPETCKYKLGDIVGDITGHQYSVGIVRELPPTPEEVRESGYFFDRQEHYSIAVVNPTSRMYAHDTEGWKMMPPLTPPDAETIRQLRHRCARWGTVPAPRCPICGGGHGWCDPDDGLHALMRQYDLRPKTASWCQVADHMLADAEGIVKRLLACGWQRRVVGISDWCGRLTVTPELQDEPAAAQLAEICAGYEVGEPEDR